MSESLGLYVHVPFCTSRCVYCDFYVETGKEHLFERYLQALRVEWKQVLHEVLGGQTPPVVSIYFGGGTPSLLPPTGLGQFLEDVAHDARVSKTAEITIEANPESVTLEKARAWRTCGINRASLGVQSFEASNLALLRRPHSVDQAVQAVGALRRAGFERMSLDLLYGLRPGGSTAYRHSVEEALRLDPGHLSCYLLTVEEGTPLGRLVREARWDTGTEDEAATDYAWTRDTLASQGYEAYEISNFARAGHRAVHNSRYWTREPYVGLGPGAHSFWDGRRWSNVAHLDRYLESVLKNGKRPVVGEERIDPRQEAEERIFLGLRQSEGFRWKTLEQCVQPKAWSRFESTRLRMTEDGWLETSDEHLRLTNKAVFVSNAVLVELVTALDETSAPNDELSVRAPSCGSL